MLYFDSVTTIHGITLYRDYNDSTRYYYLAGSPQMTREGGDPMFQLLIYRRDISDNPAFKEGDRLGGGFLTMTVDLSVPKSTLDDIKSQLSGAGGNVQLTPVPFDSGSVRISALGATSGADAASTPGGGAHFVEQIYGSTKPSLYGDNRAVFSMELSQEGATLMRASLSDPGATQIAVVYDLTYRGLMPAYQCKIKIHFQQSYSYLRNRFTMNTLYFKTDIDSEVEKLTKDGSIQITEVDFSGMDPATQAASRDKLNQLAKDLATWAFFKPALQPGAVLAVDRGQLVAADPTQAAQAVQSGFSQPLQAIATSQGAAGGTSGPRLQGESGGDANARTAGRPLPTGSGTPAGGGGGGDQAQPVSAVERWNQLGRPQAAFLMKSLTQEEQQDIEYNLFQVSATTRSAGPQGQIRMFAGAAQLPGRIKEVELDDTFFQRITGSVTTNADLGALGVSSMVVKLRYGTRDDGSSPKDSTEFVFTAAGQKQNYAFMLDRKLSMNIEYQIVVKYQSGFAIGDPSLQATSEWIKTTTRDLDIDPNEVAAVFPVDLSVAQVDWNAVNSIECTLNYDETSQGAIRQASAVLTQAKPSAAFHIRPLDPQKRSYTISAKYQFKTGQSSTVQLAGSGGKTFVLNQPTELTVPLTVIASDPLKHFSKMVVEFAYTPADNTPEQDKLMTFSSNGETQTWTLFRSSVAEKPNYKYRTTLFATNGTETQTDWKAAAEQLLVVGETFEGLLEVNLRMLVPDFRSMNLLGAKLHLEYPDAAPGVAGTKDFFFSAPVTEPTKWSVPRKSGGGKEYVYTVTWINLDGTQKVVGPRKVADEELLLHPLL